MEVVGSKISSKHYDFTMTEKTQKPAHRENFMPEKTKRQNHAAHHFVWGKKANIQFCRTRLQLTFAARTFWYSKINNFIWLNNCFLKEQFCY